MQIRMVAMMTVEMYQDEVDNDVVFILSFTKSERVYNIPFHNC
jgi:hypothetical protein